MISEDLIDPASVTTFARNEMVVVVALCRLHVGSPVLGPDGSEDDRHRRSADNREILTKLRVLTQVKPKLRTETIDQILADVATGKVDAGILYLLQMLKPTAR